MRILGLVVEYNPFHLGHLHHLVTAKRLVCPDATVAVMSGNFTQRGEPAITDKWTRAEMALRSGVDLVVELPVAWAVRSAPYFATGSTQLLAALGATDICFGSECGDLGPLWRAAELLLAESAEFKQALQLALAEGQPFAAAQGQALAAVAPELPPEIFASPNNTLGIHYLMAIREQQLGLTAHTIARTGSYDSPDTSVPMPSAKAIRSRLVAGQTSSGLPENVSTLLQQAMQNGRAPITWGDFEQAVLYRLRQLTPERISLYPEAGEGLGPRLWQAARETNRLAALWSLVKTRRFALTRLQRLLTYILLDLTQTSLDQIADQSGPSYARILAMNTDSPAIRQLLRSTTLPLVYSAARHDPLTPRAEQCLKLDLAATDCYSLAFRERGQAGLDFTTAVIR